MTADVERPVICTKCGARSGDDWSQCRGICPLPDSPHYVEQVAQEVLAEHEGDEAFDFLKDVVDKIVTRVTR